MRVIVNKNQDGPIRIVEKYKFREYLKKTLRGNKNGR